MDEKMRLSAQQTQKSFSMIAAEIRERLSEAATKRSDRSLNGIFATLSIAISLPYR